MIQIKRMIAAAIADKLMIMNAESGIDAALVEGMLEYYRITGKEEYLTIAENFTRLVAESDICFIFSTSSGVFSISATAAVFIFPYLTTYRFTGRLK